MKRRYTVLFFVALSPLIGCSWLASQFDMSIWNLLHGVGMFGMIAAAVAAGFGLLAKRNDKVPALVAAVASAPSALQMLHVLGMLRYLMSQVGASILLIAIGSVATLATSIIVTVLPPPAPPREPQVAPARIVD